MRKGAGKSRNNVGIGYIIIPTNSNRDSYISNCYRTHTVSILTEYSNIIHNVPIDVDRINQIIFPQISSEYGSLVVWVNLPFKNMPIILGVLSKSNELFLGGENQFVLNRRFKNNVVNITGDASSGKIFINIESSDEDGGELNINVGNKNHTGKINLAVDGDINIESKNNINIVSANKIGFKIPKKSDSEKETILSYEKEVGLIYIDEFENELTIKDREFKLKINDGEIIQEATKFSLGNGKYSLKDILNDFLDEISKSTVLTSLGVQPLLNKIQILQLKEKANQILK